jgi:hypothetical protein
MIGFALLLFSLNVNAAGLGEDCNGDADCDDPVNLCFIASCSSEGSVCVEQEKDCGDLLCDESDGSCVECLVNEDCDEAICEGGVCVAEGSDCSVDADCPVPENLCLVASCSSEGSVCVEQDKDCGDLLCDESDGSCVECLVDQDCDDVAICEDNVCVPEEPECTIDADCVEGFCEPVSQSCVECLSDLDCTDNGTPLCGETFSCVQCLDDTDCVDNQTCQVGVCSEEGSCGLFIKPSILTVGKASKPLKKMFTIKGVKGEEGFDPYGEVAFGPFEVIETFVAGKSNVLKVRISVPVDAMPDGESFDVLVGGCSGVVFYNTPEGKAALKNQKKLGKLEKRKKQEKDEGIDDDDETEDNDQSEDNDEIDDDEETEDDEDIENDEAIEDDEDNQKKPKKGKKEKKQKKEKKPKKK